MDWQQKCMSVQHSSAGEQMAFCVASLARRSLGGGPHRETAVQPHVRIQPATGCGASVRDWLPSRHNPHPQSQNLTAPEAIGLPRLHRNPQHVPPMQPPRARRGAAGSSHTGRPGRHGHPRSPAGHPGGPGLPAVEWHPGAGQPTQVSICESDIITRYENPGCLDGQP